MPPTVPINHYFGSRNQRKIEPKSYSIIPCLCIQAQACFEHSNFFKVNVAYPTHTQLRAREVCAKKANADSDIPLRLTVGVEPEIQLRAFQLQQLYDMLLELELPRLLAPDLPSNRSSLRDLNCTHSNYKTTKKPCIVIFCHYLPTSGLGNLSTCCLPWMW